MKKLHTKFSALNVDFDGPSLGFLGLRKPAQEGIKQRYTPVKVVILPLLASLLWKQREIDWQFANRNCYRLSRVSWALSQISCSLNMQEKLQQCYTGNCESRRSAIKDDVNSGCYGQRRTTTDSDRTLYHIRTVRHSPVRVCLHITHRPVSYTHLTLPTNREV